MAVHWDPVLESPPKVPTRTLGSGFASSSEGGSSSSSSSAIRSCQSSSISSSCRARAASERPPRRFVLFGRRLGCGSGSTFAAKLRPSSSTQACGSLFCCFPSFPFCCFFPFFPDLPLLLPFPLLSCHRPLDFLAVAAEVPTQSNLQPPGRRCERRGAGRTGVQPRRPVAESGLRLRRVGTRGRNPSKQRGSATTAKASGIGITFHKPRQTLNLHQPL